MLSYVARPITTVLSRVVARKCLRSSGMLQGMSPSLPITPFSATAATITTLSADPSLVQHFPRRVAQPDGSVIRRSGP